MLRATSVIRSHTWSHIEAVRQVTLSFDERYRRRIRLVDDAGDAFLLDLAEATRLGDGDGLVLERGGIVLVRAADEDVLDIACGDPVVSARVAWHLGNRHTPMQVLEAGLLRIAYDHVLAHMVEGLGGAARRRRAPFAPEPGAYVDGGHRHAHHQTRDESHDHHHSPH